jgi:ribokinase
MPQPSFDVIVCGSLHLDIMVYAPDLPRLDETVVGSRWGMACGGKGGNQAVMAARAGARVAMIGRLGADDFGARLLANLAGAGVDSSAIVRDPSARSGMSVAIVRNDGEYGAVIVSEANRDIAPETAATQWRKLGGAPVLVLQNEVAETVDVAIARAARASVARVLLNAAPARAMSEDLLALVDTLIVNRVEAGMMAGETVDDSTSAMRALPKLGGALRDIVVTLGAVGLIVQPRGQGPQFIAARKVAAVSTHGAGDCFVGALAAAMARGAGVIEACEAATEAAAVYVSRPRAD